MQARASRVELGEITEEQFDAAFALNARGTLFTVQKALPLFNDGGSIFMTGSNASLRGYASGVCTQRARPCCPPSHRVWVALVSATGRSG